MQNKDKGMFALVLAGSTVLVIGLLVAACWNTRVIQNSSINQGANQYPEDKGLLIDPQTTDNAVAPQIIEKSAVEWKKVCTNIAAGYQVRYPDEWSTIVGSGMDGFSTADACTISKELGDSVNNVNFAAYVRGEDSTNLIKQDGIRITVSSKERAEKSHTWLGDISSESNQKKYKEINIDGERAVWVGVWVMQHDNKQYEVSIDKGVSEDLVTEFLSTFKFLK